MSRTQRKYFCLICRINYHSPTAFFKDRQNHIAKGEMNKVNGKSKAAIS